MFLNFAYKDLNSSSLKVLIYTECIPFKTEVSDEVEMLCQYQALESKLDYM